MMIISKIHPFYTIILISIFTETLYNTQKINILIDTWSNQIRSSVIDAHKKYENNEPSEQVWLSSLNNFKNLIDLSLKTN